MPLKPCLPAPSACLWVCCSTGCCPAVCPTLESSRAEPWPNCAKQDFLHGYQLRPERKGRTSPGKPRSRAALGISLAGVLDSPQDTFLSICVSLSVLNPQERQNQTDGPWEVLWAGRAKPLGEEGGVFTPWKLQCGQEQRGLQSLSLTFTRDGSRCPREWGLPLGGNGGRDAGREKLLPQ